MAVEFSRRTESLLDRAEAVCRQRGARLTELRRGVLGLILDAAAPTGAYDLLDRLRQTRRGAAPPTVYRALDFLLKQGLIHRVIEMANHERSAVLARAAQEAGFSVTNATVEAEGLCSTCRSTGRGHGQQPVGLRSPTEP